MMLTNLKLTLASLFGNNLSTTTTTTTTDLREQDDRRSIGLVEVGVVPN